MIFFEIHSNRHDILHVHPIGAKLTLKLKSIPILVSVTRGDGKQGITHPCTPIFGPDVHSLYGLSQHGNMRNEECEISKIHENEISVHHEITDNGYPRGMYIDQTLSLDHGDFSLTTIHTNTGKEHTPVNFAEHLYFDAPKGYMGTTINGQDISTLIEQSRTGTVIDIKEENTIHIPGKSEIILRQRGFQKVTVWVGRNKDSGMVDSNYVCIEPVEFEPTMFGSKETLVLSGKNRMNQLWISVHD